MKKIFLLLFLFFFPLISLANIIFTEIMYDPAGTDTNKEYLEIKNTFNYSVNLEGYKLFEANTNHKIYDGFGNDFNLPANSFGLLVKNPDEFKIAYPNSSGFILKSSFSLKNTDGELVALKNKDGNTLDSLTYNPDSGGKNGDTLSIFNNIWKNGAATPGAENIEKSTDSNNNSDNKDDNKPKTSHSYVEITDMFAGQKKLHAEIDELKTVMAGAEFELTGRAYGLTGVEIKGIDFLWNLGDGTKDRGQKIEHEYSFPGEYLISLIVKSSGFTSPKATQKITVIDPPIKISQVDFEHKFIEITNDSNQILNLQDWILMVNGEKFTIPKNTYILENGNIKFTQKNTLLQIKPENRIFLLYPNSKKFQEYHTEPGVKPEPEKKSIKNSQPNPTTPEQKSEPKSKPKEVDLYITVTPTGITKKYVPVKTKTKSKPKQKKITKKLQSPQKPEKNQTNIVSPENKNNKITHNNNQTASILPLKKNKKTFVQNNLIEISFLAFLFSLITILFYFRKTIPENSLKKQADEFEIIEDK